MPPEVLRGEPSDQRSDIWALGVLLDEMAGTKPFSGATGFELTGAILHASPPPLPDCVPASLGRTIQRCLDKDPRLRYQSATDVRSSLEKVEHDIGRRATTPTMSTRVAGVAALIALALALTVAGLWWRQQPRAGANAVNAPVAAGPSGHPAIAVMSFDVAGTANADTAWLSRGAGHAADGPGPDARARSRHTRRLADAARQVGAGDLESLDRIARPRWRGVPARARSWLGRFSDRCEEIRIDAQMEDLASGRVLVAESVRGADLFTLVDQLASRIRDGVGVRDAASVRGVAAVSSPSLDAYRLFAQGTEAYQHARVEDATRLLEEAVRADPEFSAVYLYLGFANYFSGSNADRQRHFAKASEHMDRLSERQRLLLRAELARDAGMGADAERLLDQLFTEFPDWHDGYATALELDAPITGLVYNPEKRLAIFRRGVDAQPASALPRTPMAMRSSKKAASRRLSSSSKPMRA